jgi:hypothetical protein
LFFSKYRICPKSETYSLIYFELRLIVIKFVIHWFAVLLLRPNNGECYHGDLKPVILTFISYFILTNGVYRQKSFLINYYCKSKTANQCITNFITISLNSKYIRLYVSDFFPLNWFRRRKMSAWIISNLLKIREERLISFTIEI